MELTITNVENLAAIMNIIKDAQLYLAEQNIDQWQNGYPNVNAIKKDILNHESYIVKNKANDIMGTTMFTTKAEPTYTNINGKWLTKENAKHGVIHRMAIGSQHRKLGIAKFIFQTCEQQLKDSNITSMRIDTHEDNKSMQGLLKKLGYVYCGIIYLDNNDKRLAFEKLLL